MSESVTWKIEKRIKPKSKIRREDDRSTIMIQDATECAEVSEKENVAEMKMHSKRDKVKKKNKGADADSEKKGGSELQLTGSYGEEGSGGVMDNAERKRKKREKDKKKNDRFEMSYTEEVEKEVENAGENVEMSERKKRKREKKKRKDDNGMESLDTDSEAKHERKTDDDSTKNKTEDKDDISEKADRRKKKIKKIRKENDEGNLSALQQENVAQNVDGNIQSTKYDGNVSKKLEKKKHRKVKNSKDDSSVGRQDISTQGNVDGLLHTNEKMSNKVESAIKGKKKKTKPMENGSDDEIRDKEVKKSKKGEKKKTKLVENGSDDATPNKSNKKVRFSGEVEVFPLPGDSNTEKENDEEENLIRGKRYTPEEDEIIKEAVYKYIDKYCLGDEGLDIVLNSKKHPRVKGCWNEIGSAIPHRPYRATYYRAQIIFRRSANRKWTEEEYELIRKYQEVHGNAWKALADELGKHRFHVKDTYRRIKMENLKKGQWTQKEYQKLFDLVNTDLQLKVSEEKISKHGMLRDNIAWTAISDQLSTRLESGCCRKWYKQLTSPMVSEGVWADTDDYRLIGALYSLDATCMEDVDWDELIDERSGDVCRKRWNQMLLHIGHHGNKSFAEQVEVLAQRYCPHLLEAREAWDSKPRVP